MDLSKLHIHWRTSKYKGKTYKSYSLARAYRKDGKNRKEIVLPLGKLSEEDLKRWKIFIEGSACKLVEEFENESNPMHSLYKKLEDKDLLDCFCKACSNKMGVLEKVEKGGFPTCDEMMGHPSMAKYIEKGYNIITF